METFAKSFARFPVMTATSSTEIERSEGEDLNYKLRLLVDGSNMHPAFERIAGALAARSPIDVDGERFALTLKGIHQGPHAIAADVRFRADGLASHTGELHLGLDRLEHTEFVVESILETVRKIVRGDLPPGTRELL